MSNELWIMIGFVAFIFLMMAIDMGLFGKSEHAVSLKQAGITSAIWVGMAIGFYFLILNFGDRIHGVDNMARLQQINADHFHKLKLPGSFDAALAIYKKNLALEFITGYTIEYALSVDNIFVMVLIFSAFGVQSKYYHKVLIWGIIGALVMRFLFIFVGAALINNFHWILYVFGVFLIYTGVSMFINRNKEEKIDTEKHPVVRFASKYFAVYPKFDGGKFFVKMDGKKMITPLFLVLLIIEATDLVFAIDSIPAIFSVTKDPYIVFFSNIFAIMGLRSMFFLLVNVIDKFHYLKTGLAVLLAFIGLKMLVGEYAEHIGLTTMRSLIIILGILIISVVASLIFPKNKKSAGLSLRQYL